MGVDATVWPCVAAETRQRLANPVSLGSRGFNL